MPITAQHVKTLTIPDSTNTGIVRPSDWNSQHVMTVNLSGTEVIGAFSNGGNVSFGTDTAGYITANAPGAGTGGGAALQGSDTYTQNTGTIQFANSNNITFGLSTNVMTASFSQSVDTGRAGVGYTSTTQGGSTVGVTQNSQGLSAAWPAFVTAAGAGDGNNVIGVNAVATAVSTTYIFSNGNNVNFGINAGTITASASYVNDLTSGRAGVGETVGTIVGSDLAMTVNTDGVSIGYPKWLTTTPAQTNQSAIKAFGVAGTTGTAGNTGLSTGIDWAIAGSNLITVSGSTAAGAATAWIQHPAWLTTAAAASASNVSGIIAASASNAATNQSVQLSGGVSFANTNGVSFYTTVSGAVSGIAATVATNYVPAGNTTNFAGISSGTQSTAGAVPTMTHNTAGLNLGVPAWITTAALSGDTTKYAGVSSGTQSTAGAVPTMTHNTAGLNLGIPAWITTAALSANTSNYAGVGYTSTTQAGSTVGVTQNTAGLSMAWPPFITTAGAGGGAAISAAGNSQNTGTVSFDNAGGVSFGLSNNGVMTAAAPAAAPSPVNISAGTASANLGSVVFGASNGMVWGLGTGASSRSVTGSYNDPDNWALYANTDGSTSGTSASTIGTEGLYFKAGNNITLSGSSNSIVISGLDVSWELEGANTAGTTASQLSAGKLYFSGGPNITLSGNSNTIVISAAAAGGGVTLAGGYVNHVLFTNTAAVAYAQSTSHVVPFILQNNMAWDFVRLEMLGAISAASTTGATTGGTTFSCGYTKTHNLAIYSRGAGANSDSMQLVSSTQHIEKFSNNISCAANSTQFSYENLYTFPCSSGSIGFTHNYSSSAASINVNSASATMLTGTKFLDLPFGMSLTPGRYWLMYGMSTTTATQAFTSLGVRNAVTFNPVFISQAAQSIGMLGAATSNIYMPQKALGSFTTVGGATTASFHWSKVTASANHPQMYFQLLESN